MLQPGDAHPHNPSPGRAWADERWYLLNRDRLMRRCVKLVSSRQVAEDIVQETFARAIAAGMHRNPRSWSWLRTVARNLCIDHMRRRKRYLGFAAAPGADRDLDADAALERVVDVVDSIPGREALSQALGGLRERERGVLWLRDAEGWAYDDIADLEGITPRAAKNRAFRARDRVRACVAAAVARTLGSILVLRDLFRRPRIGAPAPYLALGGVAITLAFGGLGSIFPSADEPRQLVPVRSESMRASDPEAQVGVHLSADRSGPAATQGDHSSAPHDMVVLEFERKHRRDDALVPERTTFGVEVRDPDGNVIAYDRTGQDCSHEGEGLHLTELVVIGC